MSSIEKAVEKLKRQREQQKGSVASQASFQHQPGVRKNEGQEEQYRYCGLDDEFLSQNGYLTRNVQNTTLAEEYRNIKRPLLMHVAGKGADRPRHANIVMVTSSLPGEGKTFTAMNLALSLAMEKNTTALLIDSDVVNPALSRSLGLQEAPGLIDVLLDDDLTISDVIYKTSIPKLNLIPAGEVHTHATELLASNEMKSVIDELSQRYRDRVIILDAPPLLLTSHARVLSDLAGQILFVVEAGETLQHDIVEGVSQLDKDKVVGMVLNKSRRKSSGNYYYGAYGSNPARAADGE
jgi:exopolysaccharide/PEP-CTERM locus tyrosine autokinase